MCGLVEQCRTPDHWSVSSSLACANMFVSLGEILSLNCFLDLSASGRCRSCKILQSKCWSRMCTWPVACLGEAQWLWQFSWHHNNDIGLQCLWYQVPFKRITLLLLQNIFLKIDLIKKSSFTCRRKTGWPWGKLCTYITGTGNQTWAQWCITPGKKCYATCFPHIYIC